MPPLRSCSPSRCSASTVSSVRQAIRLGGTIKTLALSREVTLPHQPDASALNSFEMLRQGLRDRLRKTFSRRPLPAVLAPTARTLAASLKRPSRRPAAPALPARQPGYPNHRLVLGSPGVGSRVAEPPRW